MALSVYTMESFSGMPETRKGRNGKKDRLG